MNRPTQNRSNRPTTSRSVAGAPVCSSTDIAAVEKRLDAARWMTRDNVAQDIVNSLSNGQIKCLPPKVYQRLINELSGWHLSSRDAAAMQKLRIAHDIYYDQELRNIIDSGVVDIDEIFRTLCQRYTNNSSHWNAKNDITQILEALWDILGTNYGSLQVGDQKRWKSVRSSLQTNKKFKGEMDKLQHFLAGAGVSAGYGETIGWVAAWLVEKADSLKRVWGDLWGTRKAHHIGFDWADFEWTAAGASFAEVFDQNSEAKCKNLFKAFASGKIQLSAIYVPTGLSGGFGELSPAITPGIETNIDLVDDQVEAMEKRLESHM